MNVYGRRFVGFLILALLLSLELSSFGGGLASALVLPAPQGCAGEDCCPGPPPSGSSRCEHCDPAVPLSAGAVLSRGCRLRRVSVLWETELPLSPYHDVPSPVPILS